jgi:hypothetical protein
MNGVSKKRRLRKQQRPPDESHKFFRSGHARAPCAMGFESDSSEFERISTKKLAILFGLAFLGAFMVIQMVQGFPLADLLFRQTTTEQVNVSLKQEDVCVVEPADGQPKSIQNCPYNVGDTLIVTYYEGSTNVESHRRNE